MNFRLQVQLAEVMGSDNRWYCAQAHGRKIDDPALLWIHFIRSGGAKNFAERYEQAMGAKNRWYCSEHHGHSITDPVALWNYYVEYCRVGACEQDSPDSTEAVSTELVLALD